MESTPFARVIGAAVFLLSLASAMRITGHKPTTMFAAEYGKRGGLRPTDSPAAAVNVSSPNAAQLKLINAQFTQFMHFGPCTFNNCEWGIPPPSPTTFNPTNLDAAQWVRVAQSWGADEICLTVRHVDGFALWPTKATNYSVAASPWKNGAGDVVAEFVAAARAGLQVCFYFIIPFDVSEVLRNVSSSVYYSHQLQMLTELLTQYGPIDRVWLDNFVVNSAADQPYWTPGFSCANNVLDSTCPLWQQMVAAITALAPNTAFVPGPHGCLVNAEVDGGTYPLFSYADAGTYGCQLTGDPSTQFMVVESDYTILSSDAWFWAPEYAVMTPGYLYAQVLQKAGQGANLILNVPPDITGQIPDAEADMLSNFSVAWKATFDAPVAQLAAPVVAPCPQLSFVITVPAAGRSAVINVLQTVEDLSAGQLITGYSVEYASAFAPNTWLPLAVHGQSVGRRVIDTTFGNLTNVGAFRWNCTSSFDDTRTAHVKSFAAFTQGYVPP